MAEGRVKGTKKMQSGVRSKTAHRTLEQARESSAGYEAQPHRRKLRGELKKARKELGLKVGDGKEASHDVAASNGGGTNKENMSVKTRSANRRQGTKSNVKTRGERKKTAAKNRIQGS